jgi:flavin-dependent dehydrogenase
MSGAYDAIVVGARCGGSSTALLLARRGYRVLVVDKATFSQRLPCPAELGGALYAAPSPGSLSPECGHAGGHGQLWR